MAKTPYLPSTDAGIAAMLAAFDNAANANEGRVVNEPGKTLFILGLVLTVAGAVLWKTGGLGGLGRLPGDIFVQRGNGTFYFPIVTCLIVSAVLTLLAWLFRR